MSNEFWEKVSKFEIILRRFNAVHSLTNYKNLRAVAEDSVAPFLTSQTSESERGNLDFKFENGKTAEFTLAREVIIDIGSGAGFPAIFIAFLLPECEIHLFEPAPKKSAFLAYAKSELGLKNVVVHAAKIEACEKFRADLITSRAVTRARDLVALCEWFYDENTTFLLYKGGEASNEAAELAADNSNLNYVIKNGAGERKYLYLKGLKCC